MSTHRLSWTSALPSDVVQWEHGFPDDSIVFKCSSGFVFKITREHIREVALELGVRDDVGHEPAVRALLQVKKFGVEWFTEYRRALAEARSA